MEWRSPEEESEKVIELIEEEVKADTKKENSKKEDLVPEEEVFEGVDIVEEIPEEDSDKYGI